MALHKQFNRISLFINGDLKVDSAMEADATIFSSLLSTLATKVFGLKPEVTPFFGLICRTCFGFVLILCGLLVVQVLQMYIDTSGSRIAFNSSGAVFANLRYFRQCHLTAAYRSQSPVALATAYHYWFVT